MILGTNGSRETLVVDSRDPLAPVALIEITSDGWANALQQMPVDEFISEVEAGTFTFTGGTAVNEYGALGETCIGMPQARAQP